MKRTIPHTPFLYRVIENSELRTRLTVVVDGYTVESYFHPGTNTTIEIGAYEVDDDPTVKIFGRKENLRRLEALLVRGKFTKRRNRFIELFSRLCLTPNFSSDYT